MKKYFVLGCLALAACAPPPVPGYEFVETVQSVDDSLPGGFTFVQNIPFVSVTRVADTPLTPADRDLAIAALRQYCAAQGTQFTGSGVDLTLGLPTFRDGAWLIAGQCQMVQPPAAVGTVAQVASDL